MTDVPGGFRVAWKADGEEIWFESGTSLTASPEAAVCLCLLPAMRQGRDLAVDDTLDPRFRDGLPTVRSLVEEFFGFRGGDVRAIGSRPAVGGTGDALFFTGGVDSFAALRKLEGSLTHLVYVEGFDVDLDDEPRLASIRKLLTRVADAHGLHRVLVRTNLRRTRLFSRVSWVATHGSALSAVGHLLTGHLARARIASDGLPENPRGRYGALGDPARSSSALTLIHEDASVGRYDKIRRLADWPEAMGDLRVCWLNEVPGFNCGLCEKCLRTRVALRAAGLAHDPPVLGGPPLVQAIAALAPTRASNAMYWRQVLRPGDGLPPGELRRVVEDFIDRCLAVPPDVGLRRVLRKTRRFLSRLVWRPPV